MLDHQRQAQMSWRMDEYWAILVQGQLQGGHGYNQSSWSTYDSKVNVI